MKVIVPFVDLATQHELIAEDIAQAIHEVVRRSDFILGEQVSRFEAEFAAYVEGGYAVGVDSGSSALELGLLSLGIGPGDEVITAANTFIASASAIVATGARPILVDVDPHTYTMDPRALKGAITPRTKAILPVHLYGQPADLDLIKKTAQENELLILEDACQAHGATYKGRKAGSIGDAAAFSFYPAKNLGAWGDGGILVTNSESAAEKVRMFRNYGQSRKYFHDFPGYNRRLDTIQAAILRVKLQHLDSWNNRRREVARQYDEAFSGLPLICPSEASYALHVYHLYVIRCQARDSLQTFLSTQGIATGVHYPIPVHEQKSMEHLGYKRSDFPVTEQCAREILSLPMFPTMSDEQVSTVTTAVQRFFRSQA